MLRKLIVLVFLAILNRQCTGLEHICYFTAWVSTKPPPYLCTTIIYSFADMKDGVMSGVDSNPLLDLKNANPSIKLLLAVGGWDFGVTRMTEMMATQATRQKFADHAVKYLRELHFDGLDLDFEYPGVNYPEFDRYSPPEDKQRFTLLCQVINIKINTNCYLELVFIL
jgi:chitinase